MERFCDILKNVSANEYIQAWNFFKTYNGDFADAVSAVPEGDSGTAQYRM